MEKLEKIIKNEKLKLMNKIDFFMTEYDLREKRGYLKRCNDCASCTDYGCSDAEYGCKDCQSCQCNSCSGGE